MYPAFQRTLEPVHADTSSCEILHPGLYYTSAYYEEEQLYTDVLDPCSPPCKHDKTTPFMNPPVQILEHSATNIDLPPITWHGYKTVPKILNLTNTGRTILINGQWAKGRPYIEGGPLNGAYIFSQIHFHSPSEHEVGGKRYPLEMHVVHYKTSYLTQERAMQERDGTVVLVYLFQVLESNETPLSSVTKLAPQIVKVNSRTETKDISLEQIVRPFTSKYYVYWGSVVTGKTSYLLQWIVNGSILDVTKQEADELLGIMNFDEINNKNAPRMKPENGAIFYVEEIEQEQEEQQECKNCRSYQEWWCSHYAHSCENAEENELHEDYSPINLQFDAFQKHQLCKCKSALVHRSHKTYSGLRMCCCHRKKKPKKKVCEPQTCSQTASHVCSETASKTCSQTASHVCSETASKTCSQTASHVCSETASNICSQTASQTCVYPQQQQENVCEPKQEEKPQETISCPSVSTDVDLPDCEIEQDCIDKEIVKLKVVCSCPSVKKCPSSKECSKEEFKIKVKKKKKSDSCKNTSSSQSCKTKFIKKKSEKKEESCESEKDDCNTENQCIRKKEKKTFKISKKKEKRQAEGCETQTSCSKTSSGSKKKEKRKSEECVRQPSCSKTCAKNQKKERKHLEEYETHSSCSKTSVGSRKSRSKSSKACQEVPVECVITTMPEKSFDEILREYDTNWLNDSKLKFSSQSHKLSEDSSENSKSKEIVSIKKSEINAGILLESLHSNRESSFVLSLLEVADDLIRTLFEKKREVKSVESPPPPEDSSVNFLLKPSSRRSNPSSAIISPKSTTEELKCVEKEVSKKTLNVPDITVNAVTLSGVQVPAENMNESPKEFCVQVELLFHSNNKDFSECVTQEYNLALMYNQNILQEYRGTLRPNTLQIGNYERLELVPKYPDLDNISIRLEDCTVKMESLDQLCMRAKFLLKEINFKDMEPPGEKMSDTNSGKKIIMLSDAITQCSTKEFDKPKENFLDKININARISETLHKKTTFEEPKLSSELSKLLQSCEQLNFKDDVSEKEECNVKPSKKPDIDPEEASLGSSSLEQMVEPKKIKNNAGKELTKKAVKELKNLFSNQKKTVYFMYEKIEKDENSGKKIFVGSFRPKDEVKNISKNKKSPPNSESPETFDNNEGKNVLVVSSKEWTSDDFVGGENNNERELKIHSPTHSKNVLQDKKDVVTLHKFKPKQLGVKNNKKERLNLVVGKALNQLQKDSKNYKRLADLVGIDKKDISKISIYELQESSENEDSETVSSKTAASEDSKNVESLDVASDKKINEKSFEPKPSVTGNRKALTKKASQGAVIIIPVEVESLSKVEVILVEHSENSKKSVVKRGKEVIPCLNFGE